MFLKHLELQNFRNYDKVEIGFNESIILLTGSNGAGKTNLLESLFILSNGKSHKLSGFADIIKWGRDFALIRAIVEAGSKESVIEFLLNSNGTFKLRINKIYIKNKSELSQNFSTVFFSPDDLKIIKSSPVYRRQFLDDILEKTDPGFSKLRLKYQRILNQRNSLLKTLSSSGNRERNSTIDAWDENLVKSGKEIIEKRTNLVKKISPLFKKYMNYFFEENFAQINYILSWERSENKNSADLNENNFLSDTNNSGLLSDSINNKTENICKNTEEIFFEKIIYYFKKDLMIKTTSIGPHRDDFEVCFNKRDIRIFGSQGQQRIAAICLKLCELEIISESINKKPLLLLDDVFSELDPKRKDVLLSIIGKGFQTFITAANFAYLKGAELRNFAVFNVKDDNIIKE